MREVSVAFQGNKTLPTYAALGAMAERLGFDRVSVFADFGYQPSIGPLLAIAGATTRVKLGPAAMNTYLTHPVEIAGQIVLLDQASNGRAVLGLARGAWLEALGIEDGKPLTRLREAVDVIRHLLRGDEGGYEGSIFSLPTGKLLQYRVERPEVPLLIGSWGPKLLAFSGETADEVKIGGSANPAYVAVARKHLATGAAKTGRSADAIGIVFGAVTVVSEDGERARALARKEVALYLPVVAPLDPTVQLDPENLARMGALVAAGDVDGAAALVPDDVLDRFAFAGTPEQVTRQAAALFDAGATRVEFGTPHGFTPDEGVRLLGERVLPGLR